MDEELYREILARGFDNDIWKRYSSKEKKEMKDKFSMYRIRIMMGLEEYIISHDECCRTCMMTILYRGMYLYNNPLEWGELFKLYSPNDVSKIIVCDKHFSESRRALLDFIYQFEMMDVEERISKKEKDKFIKTVNKTESRCLFDYQSCDCEDPVKYIVLKHGKRMNIPMCKWHVSLLNRILPGGIETKEYKN